ncbi:hypothetical protein XENOCAPTIV_006786 [Xenoophorus captivus]|uniref:Uncharacterized protein n=1 Tax=Xenoophorus captivus TaxID=1517983 RepID=A0ABV0S1L5_9TELE
MTKTNKTKSLLFMCSQIKYQIIRFFCGTCIFFLTVVRQEREEREGKTCGKIKSPFIQKVKYDEIELKINKKGMGTVRVQLQRRKPVSFTLVGPVPTAGKCGPNLF